MKGNALLDLRNIYESDEATREGFAYFPVGR